MTRVVVERAVFNLRDYLWSGTLGLFAFLGQTLVVLFVTLFLLASGDTFRRKMVKLAGPRLSQKKITIQALDEVSRISSATCWSSWRRASSSASPPASRSSPSGWPTRRCGASSPRSPTSSLTSARSISACGSALVGFIQFDSVDKALLIGAGSFAIHGIVGNLLTPWWTGRASRMSPFAVFIGVLAFGWLWGAVGLILGTPILMVVKTVCDRIDELKPVGEFLGA